MAYHRACLHLRPPQYIVAGLVVFADDLSSVAGSTDELVHQLVVLVLLVVDEELEEQELGLAAGPEVQGLVLVVQLVLVLELPVEPAALELVQELPVELAALQELELQVVEPSAELEADCTAVD